MSKFLTLITPTKNPKIKDLSKLSKDIKNLKKIIYPNLLEWIIIDYKSDPFKVSYIKKIKKKFDIDLKILFIEESGIYEAYNLGFKKSTGEWNIFIGSDDRILYKNFYSLIDILNTFKDFHIISLPSRRVLENKKIELLPSKLFLLFQNTIPHPSTLINKKIKLILGSSIYPTNFKIAGDYYFFLKSFLRKNIKIKVFKKFKPLILHYSYGLSNNKKLSRKELIDIQNKLLGFSTYFIIYNIKEFFKKLFFNLYQNKQ